MKKKRNHDATLKENVTGLPESLCLKIHYGERKKKGIKMKDFIASHIVFFFVREQKGKKTTKRKREGKKLYQMK